MAAADDCFVKHAKALTDALEKGAFEKAEALIRGVWHPKCLNIDVHRPSPLTLVLSGKAGYFNLHLAKLLVQYGANLNVRYVRATPLERVIKMYLDTKALCAKQETSNSLLTIGLNGEVNPPLLKLKEQLSVLLEMLLASGANPTLITLNPTLQSTLHKVVAVEDPDIDLVMKLYRWGGNLDRGDVHGTTPLMDHIIEASRDRALPLVDKVLCEVPELDLNHTNCCNETMFWRAMSAGSPTVAVRLLRNGADPTIDVSITRKRETAPIPLSPIFAPLLQSSALYSSKTDTISFSVPGLNKVMLSSVFPVVDCTDICDSVCDKLEPVLSSRTRFPMRYLSDQEYRPHHVAFLLLGHFKAGLQQMCVRRIMEHLIVKKHCLWKDIIETGRLQIYDGYSNGSMEEKDCDQLSLVAMLNPLIIAILRRELGLPVRVERRFLIEAARLQVGTCFFATKKPECFRNCQERTRYLAMCS
ncbi:uncharacterized protein [Anabrus simplex]